jgi:hypothetical protein
MSDITLYANVGALQHGFKARPKIERRRARVRARSLPVLFAPHNVVACDQRTHHHPVRIVCTVCTTHTAYAMRARALRAARRALPVHTRRLPHARRLPHVSQLYQETVHQTQTEPHAYNLQVTWWQGVTVSAGAVGPAQGWLLGGITGD